jgi:hypothetical protein
MRGSMDSWNHWYINQLFPEGAIVRGYETIEAVEWDMGYMDPQNPIGVPRSRHEGMRTMCGSRTGGWSLPCVMSDWQRCVDWILAKYCRCRLRLDCCWCRWRTSMKGRRRWGLHVWRRQVGLVRGTRWPAESSVGRMVAWTARQSHGRFLGWASKPRSSRDYVGAKSWVEIGGG